MSVKIQVERNRVSVQAPYNQLFIQTARSLDGKWDDKSKAWVFNVQEELAVRNACLRYYGTDGVLTEQVDIRVSVGEGGVLRSCKKSLTLFGRVVAKGFGRDSGATTGQGIILESGGFSTGGSYINWTVYAYSDTTFIMRGAPKQLVDEYGGQLKVEVLPSGGRADPDELLAEKKRLEMRLVEVNKLIEQDLEK